MYHKLTSLFLPLLCLFILASLALTAPEPVEGQPESAEGVAHPIELTMPQLAKAEPTEQQLPLNNHIVTDTLRLPSFNSKASQLLRKPASSSSSENVELVGQIGGPSLAVAVEGNGCKPKKRHFLGLAIIAHKDRFKLGSGS